mmetsp:Transcript_28559/g.60887  ORF Transcript_28559/g.60887 Transcript_28559/m.60887 type:complete len:100 (+) Transcript_28559:653-952(+)
MKSARDGIIAALSLSGDGSVLLRVLLRTCRCFCGMDVPSLLSPTAADCGCDCAVEEKEALIMRRLDRLANKTADGQGEKRGMQWSSMVVATAMINQSWA